MTTIAVIGAGNMGSSIIGGLLQSGHSPDKLWATDRDENKLKSLQERLKIHVTTDNHHAAHHADVIILAIKPQYMADVTKNLRAIVAEKNMLVISVAAGVREKNIQHWLNGNAAIVRTMPNTPALIGCGATALFANAFVSPEQRNLAESILRAVGIVVWVEQEIWLDTITALSGCGPAYFFLVMEALQEAAEQCGLPKDIARLLTLQTALGAAKMALESGKSVKELRQNVTSPGGATEKAIAVLEENQLREIFKKAIEAARLRSAELADTISA